MSKTFIIKIPKTKLRNSVAREMILSGQGKGKFHKPGQERRSKDARARREWDSRGIEALPQSARREVFETY